MKTLVLVGIFLAFFEGFAQINHPKASPFSRTEQRLGLATISVEYSRPAVRSRKIWDGLVPYGRIWRVGANESTKLTTDSELSIMGNILPPGTYALYAFPEKGLWEFAFHGNIGHWGDGRTAYNPSEDIFRITLVPETVAEHQENFLITFHKLDHNSMDMLLRWEYLQWRIPIKIDTHALMEREIAHQIKNNPTAQTYYEAAHYLQEQGKAAERALEYLENAIKIGGDTYYFYRVKALVEADLQQYAAAIRSAQKSMVLADKEGKDEFVRMNLGDIAKWEELMPE